MIGAKNGIELIEPNERLAKAYIGKAESSLKASQSLKDNREWRISSLYYTMYFSVYAILIRIGVKCEIHSCTISFAKAFLNQYLDEDEISFLKRAMKARIDTQYYTDKDVPDTFYREMIEKAAHYMTKCKDIISMIPEKNIMEIRDGLHG